MLTGDELQARREVIAESEDLTALLRRLTDRAAPALARMPFIPRQKALLSTDGGVCGMDGTPLGFDPWKPGVYACPRCGREHRGERFERFHARLQHLWVAERAAHLATVGVLGGHRGALERAREIVADYAEHYFEYPNRDNVLGPSRLFFSTYMESIWLTNYLAAAWLLREAGALDHGTAEGVTALADEAANIIGEFNEGLSNRQTWNNAALVALAGWFEDEELARRSLEGTTGLLAHLVDGFGADGMWYEGDNYHLFALRGLLVGAGWARLAGADLFGDPRFAGRLDAALRAPTISALPNFDFPARKDARFGVSLAQPMYLELWEVGEGQRGGGVEGQEEPLWMRSWLQSLYRVPTSETQVYESYLHEAGEPTPSLRSRADLSWWALLTMSPAPLQDSGPWAPRSELMVAQGLAILRHGDRYASLECGEYGGGHGHPDRLHLTLHANRVHWLPDPGTGSYVSRDLFWYRSTLAHNAPRIDGVSQPPGDAVCEHYQSLDGWAWMRGRYRNLVRTLVASPGYLLDIVESSAEQAHGLELPWHLNGDIVVETAGRWEPAEPVDEFVTRVERFDPATPGPISIVAKSGDHLLRLLLVFDGDLLRAEAPGLPLAGGRTTFLFTRSSGRYHRIVAVLDTTGSGAGATALEATGEIIAVATPEGTHRHRSAAEGWVVDLGGSEVRLAGPIPPQPKPGPILPVDLNRPEPPMATAHWVDEAPALDGNMDGFDWSDPIALEVEDQYRRSEEPYPGPEAFSAQASLCWNEHGLYIAVSVIKDTLDLRPPDAPPLRLDNERDDIHSDGLQVYLNRGGAVYGVLLVPDPSSSAVRVLPVEGTSATAEMVEAQWRASEGGYDVTVGLRTPGWDHVRRGERLGFDLLVNEMRPDRLRRAGQLVWSGGNGWVYLRGDRQDPARFGHLELR